MAMLTNRNKYILLVCISAILLSVVLSENFVGSETSIENSGTTPYSSHPKSSYYNPLPEDLEQNPDHPDRHKDLFPLDATDIWGTVLVTLGLLVAASGGIGGGGILVPLFILIFEFKPKYAIPLSNFCILGSSITNMALNLAKRHPNVDRPLVDWDLILVMEPLTMAGAVSISLFLFLLSLSYSLLVSGYRCFHEQSTPRLHPRYLLSHLISIHHLYYLR